MYNPMLKCVDTRELNGESFISYFYKDYSVVLSYPSHIRANSITPENASEYCVEVSFAPHTKEGIVPEAELLALLEDLGIDTAKPYEKFYLDSVYDGWKAQHLHVRQTPEHIQAIANAPKAKWSPSANGSRFLKERYEALCSMDLDKIAGYCKKYDVETPGHPLVFWCAMYKVIYQISQSAAQRKQASDWLLSHGFHLPERYAYQ